MKYAFASLLIASLSLPALAQAPAKPAANGAAKPAAQAGATPARSPKEARAKRRAAVKALTTGQKQAIETLAPMEEPDPAIKLDPRDLEVAKRVHMGEISCELGAHVEIKAMKREGFFLVKHRLSRFVMHPVFSRTGAIRLEDPARGAVWLQLGNKSMLMNQKEGKRLADECQSPDQVVFARDMKPVNLLEPAPAAAAAAAPASAAAAVPMAVAPATAVAPAALAPAAAAATAPASAAPGAPAVAATAPAAATAPTAPAAPAAPAADAAAPTAPAAPAAPAVAMDAATVAAPAAPAAPVTEAAPAAPGAAPTQ